jgi:hypothetical protein
VLELAPVPDRDEAGHLPSKCFSASLFARAL